MPGISKNKIEEMWVNWESVSDGAKPHIRFSLRNLQFCSYTYQAFFKLLCNIWSKLPSTSEFLGRIEILVVDIQTFFWTSKNAVKWIQFDPEQFCACGLKFTNFASCKKFLSGNFIFRWPYIIEYCSDLHEKWMVREVNICSFWGVWRKYDGLVAKGLRQKMLFFEVFAGSWLLRICRKVCSV